MSLLAKIVVWILGVAIALAGAALAYRTIAQHGAANRLAIETPGGIQEGLFVRLGGIEQWVSIRGNNRANPVVLVVHGGPGMSYGPLAPYFQSWEKDFTVVQWDRRGVGKTYARNGSRDSAAITFDRLAGDGIELTEWLRAHLGRPKLILVGHSVGSVVATLMAQRRPTLFAAYVGTDQIVDMRRNEAVSYDMLLDRARATRDEKLISAAIRIGPPPYKSVDEWFEKQRLISATDPIAPGYESHFFKLMMTAPGFSLREQAALGAGLKYAASALLHEMMTLDLGTRVTKLDLPVVIVEGAQDVIDPTVLAVEWFEKLEAPSKKLVVVPGAGHNVMLMHPDVLLRELQEIERHSI